jgi:kumamolisin
VTVIAAAGDKLATTGENDNHAHVLFPASSPSVLACGGTNLKFAADGKTFADETVWNDGLSGTGGGISDLFSVPDYQRSVSLPNSSNLGRIGRGLPDLAAAASTSPGYKVVFNGKIEVECGTSAATPLWAALIAIANAKRGRPVGSIHNFLYQNPQLFREITDGNNRLDGIGYYAAPLWNACTGLGVPKGPATVQALVEMP